LSLNEQCNGKCNAYKSHKGNIITLSHPVVAFAPQIACANVQLESGQKGSIRTKKEAGDKSKRQSKT
jgi:hypothetical protein